MSLIQQCEIHQNQCRKGTSNIHRSSGDSIPLCHKLPIDYAQMSRQHQFDTHSYHKELFKKIKSCEKSSVNCQKDHVSLVNKYEELAQRFVKNMKMTSKAVDALKKTEKENRKLSKNFSKVEKAAKKLSREMSQSLMESRESQKANEELLSRYTTKFLAESNPVLNKSHFQQMPVHKTASPEQQYENIASIVISSPQDNSLGDKLDDIHLAHFTRPGSQPNPEFASDVEKIKEQIEQISFQMDLVRSRYLSHTD